MAILERVANYKPALTTKSKLSLKQKVESFLHTHYLMDYKGQRDNAGSFFSLISTEHMGCRECGGPCVSSDQLSS